MQLPQPIARLMNEIFSGKNPADLARIGITTITLVLTLLAATAAGSSTPNDDGSSNDDPAPENPDYTAPPAHIQGQLDTIQAEVYEAVNKIRTAQGLSMIFKYPERQQAAQNKAELNAVTGKEDNVDADISMSQAHLPLNEASGYEFIERLRNDPDHLAVMMDPNNLHMAVGVAYSVTDDTVWLVLQFE